MNTKEWCYSYSNGVAPVSQMSQTTGEVEFTEANSSKTTDISKTDKAEKVDKDPESAKAEEVVKDSKSVNSAATNNKNILSYPAKLFKREAKVKSYTPKKTKRYRGSSHNPKTPECDDRDDEYNIRKSSPVPDFMLDNFGLNVTRARTFEKISHKYTDYVNSVGGYVSDCALGYQKSSLGYEAITDEHLMERRVKRRELVAAGKKALGLPRYLKDIL
jgi:hypothetical protein